MIDFILKSTISLGTLYLFYILFLGGIKTFKFNRYFLLGSLVFSLVIPFIIIPVERNVLPLIETTGNLSMTNAIEYSSEFISSTNGKWIIDFNILFLLCGSICLMLFLRFCFNLFNIIKRITNNQKKNKNGYTIVLLNERVLPYTFFKYILVNREDYVQGNIDDSLIQHEITHCKQLHSIDIVFMELIKIFLWINPFIWLLKKEIQLNHEFLADDSVLSNHDIISYRKMLIDLVLNKNAGILISNFNFSFTKQRLKMMTKHFSRKKAISSKIASLMVFIILGILLSCSQEDLVKNSTLDKQNEWWHPALKAHNIKPVAYNNFENVFEMGTKNSITNGLVELENAVFIFKPVRREDKKPAMNSYVMVKAPFAQHNLTKDSISAENGELKMFSLKEGKVSSANLLKFSKLKMYVNDRKFWFRVDKGTNHKISENGEITNEGKYFDNIIVRY